jgi:hypothetical protein
MYYCAFLYSKIQMSAKCLAVLEEAKEKSVCRKADMMSSSTSLK